MRVLYARFHARQFIQCHQAFSAIYTDGDTLLALRIAPGVYRHTVMHLPVRMVKRTG